MVENLTSLVEVISLPMYCICEIFFCGFEWLNHSLWCHINLTLLTKTTDQLLDIILQLRKDKSTGLWMCMSKRAWVRDYWWGIKGHCRQYIMVVTQASSFYVGGCEHWSFVAHLCLCDKASVWETPPTISRLPLLWEKHLISGSEWKKVDSWMWCPSLLK